MPDPNGRPGRARLVAPALLLITLTTPEPSAGQVQTKDQQKCTAAMQAGIQKTSSALGKGICACITAGAKGRLAGTIEDCIGPGDLPKVLAAEAKVAKDFAKRCAGSAGDPPAPRLPPYGVTDPATLGAAARAKELALFHDVFGADLDLAIVAAAVSKDGAKCQARLAKDVKKCQDVKLKQLAACVKKGLKDKVVPFDDAGDLEACLGADPKGAIAKKCHLREEPRPGRLKLDGIRKSLAKTCEAKGVDLAAAFPGCGAAGVETTHACLDRAVECRVCLAVNTAFGLARDCDLFDDGAANFSCPALLVGAHTCAVVPTASGFLLETPELILSRGLEGGVQIDCGVVDPATGAAPCTCELAALEPVEVFQLGWACIGPAAGCAPGLVDCDGGDGLDVATASLHNIGPCTGNADCAGQCAATCGATGGAVLESGCEGFCAGGASAGETCVADVLCPDGICTGPDGVFHGNVCQCQCLRVGGNPSVPGGLRCNLGVHIAVEQNLPCDGTDVLIDTGTHCVPFSTEQSALVITGVNNVAGEEFGPDGGAVSGVARECPALAGSAAGLGLLSLASLLDAPLVGDAVFIFFFDCQ